MRKLSVLRTMLVVGLVISLAGSVAFVGKAETQDFNLTTSGDGLSLTITSSANLTVDNFDPTLTTNGINDASTELKVLNSTKDNWELTTSVALSNFPAEANKTAVLDAFGVDLDTTTLHERITNSDDTNNTISGPNGAFTNIIYDYNWVAMDSGGATPGPGALANMPDGSYTITVTYNLTSTSTA